MSGFIFVGLNGGHVTLPTRRTSCGSDRACSLFSELYRKRGLVLIAGEVQNQRQVQYLDIDRIAMASTSQLNNENDTYLNLSELTYSAAVQT
eukprot:5766445-Amphidinium_carterae.1